MMRRLFYHYKPTRRWERTITRARLTKRRRKSSRMYRRLNINRSNKAFLNLYNQNNADNQSLNLDTIGNSVNNTAMNNIKKIQEPTHFYSVVNKRATRYRHQIYKDVLQHWYYSPFNRLLLKLDVDSFIRRQPFSHFLTKNEENLLHLRRFLLSEHYNTLRWYTYMQHYETMKNKIGGTKSFASKTYNQQFQGTFKKIRHLFALTPSLNQPTVSNNDSIKNTESMENKNSNSGFKILKFDQLLYNEFPNIENNSSVENSFIHEELLNNYNQSAVSNKDLINQSSEIVKQYIVQSIPIRQELIKKLLEEKNYSELTKFLWKGEKIRGIEPVSNEKSFLKQENNLLYSKKDQDNLKEQQAKKIHQLIKNGTIQKNLWINLIQQSKNLVYNRVSLQTYVNKKMSLYSTRQKSKQNKLKKRINRIQKWLLNKNSNLNEQNSNNLSNIKDLSGKNNISLTTAVRKAIKESIGQITLNNNAKNIKNSNRLLLKREQISNYLQTQLKSKKLLTIYSLKKFMNDVSDINTLVKTQSLTINFESPKITNDIMNRTWYAFSKIAKLNLKPFLNIVEKLYSKPASLILKERNDKDLVFWRKKEKGTKSIGKKKRGRNQFKKLRQMKMRNQITLDTDDLNLYNQNNFGNSTLRKKQDLETKWNKLEKNKRIDSWNKTIQQIRKDKNNSELNRNNKFTFLNKIFDKQFKRKKTRRRTFAIRGGYRPIKKRALSSNFTREFNSNLQNNPNLTNEEKNIKIFEIQTGKAYNGTDIFNLTSKNTKIREKKHRYWRKHRRTNYMQIKQKKRKRRRSALGKIKTLAKKYKKIKNYNAIRKWWWQNFLPNFQSKTDALWELENNKQLKQNIEKLSANDILKRDNNNYEKISERVFGEKKLQIGNKDYKPLNIPEAIRIRKNLIENNILNFGVINNENKNLISKNETSVTQTPNSLKDSENLPNINNLNGSNVLNQIYGNILGPTNASTSQLFLNKSKFMFGTNPVPFYAGWDESLRKFVVTNRLLSKSKASYEFNLSNTKESNNLNNYPTLKNLKTNKFDFKNSPLQGMNNGTILYSKVLFTTYDPDQFFAEGIDGFAPIGWRRFKFRHSIKTIKPLLVRTQTFTNQNFLNTNKKNVLVYKINKKLLNNANQLSSETTGKENFDKQMKRRIIKSRPKKEITKRPRIKNYGQKTMLWFPSGSLTQQMLPAHYIYVFFKRYRLPNDRYIHRRLRNNKKEVPFNLKNINTTLTDLTLRRRIKPRRRYHRKNSYTQTLNLLPRRRAFRIAQDNNLASEKDNFITRPFSKLKTMTTTLKTKTSTKLNKRVKNKIKTDPNNTRIRRLRKRVPMQIIRPGIRYAPQQGGFIWPGDYFRLELQKGRKLETQAEKNEQAQSQKQDKKLRKKAKPLVGRKWPLPLQPKKYLLQKHNVKVLKRRLEKSQNLNKIHQKINELNFLLNN